MKTKNNFLLFTNYLVKLGVNCSNYLYYNLWFVINHNRIEITNKSMIYIQHALQTIKYIIFMPSIVYINNQFIIPLFRNKSLLYWISLLFNIIVFIFIWLLITTNVALNINTELWSEISGFISMKLGLLEFNNRWGLIMTSYRSIFGIKSSIILGVLWSIINIFCFILCNFQYILLNILGIVFTRAFLLNFSQKHSIVNIWNFLFGQTPNKNGIKEIISLILNNLKQIIYYLIKSAIISILIVIVVRFIVYLLFKDHGNISNGLILIMAIPIASYFINIALKKIKKQTIKSDDYYLFNNFVVNNTNLYKIIFILSINYVVRNYYDIYIISIIFICIVLVLLLGFIYFNLTIKLKLPFAAKEGIMLRSMTGQFLSTVSGFVALAPVFQQACIEGYMDYMAPKNNHDKYVGWKGIPFNQPGVYHMGEETLNYLWRFDTLMTKNTLDCTKLQFYQEQRDMLDKSPILNMTYNLSNTDFTYGTHHTAKAKHYLPDHKLKNLPHIGKKELRTINFFNHKDFYGSVTEVVKERFLIVILIRRNWNSSIFIPTFYLPDNTAESINSVDNMTHILRSNYNINLPSEENSKSGYMIFTQGEKINDSGLFRVWRPSMRFTEPELIKDNVRVKDYFKLHDSNITRLEEFRFEKEINRIKKFGSKNVIQTSEDNQDQIKIKEVLLNEVKADRINLNLYRKYLFKDFDDNLFARKSEIRLSRKEFDPGKFQPEELIEYLCKQSEIHNRYIKEFRSLNKERTQLEKWKESMDAVIFSMVSNHVSANKNSIIMFARRNYPVTASIRKLDESMHAFVHIAQEGVIEGFKNSNQTLGELNTEFYLSLQKSRISTLSSMAHWYDKNFEDQMKLKAKSIYAISINRLSFEFLEVRRCSNIRFSYKTLYDTPNEKAKVKFDLGSMKAKEVGFELFSIVDMNNDNSKFPLVCNQKYLDVPIPKHDYHFFDNKDEHSIRKFMDHMYGNNKGYLTYKSDIPNVLVSDHPMDVVNSHENPQLLNDNGEIIRRINPQLWFFKPVRFIDLGLPWKIIDKEWGIEDLPKPLNNDQLVEYFTREAPPQEGNGRKWEGAFKKIDFKDLMRRERIKQAESANRTEVMEDSSSNTENRDVVMESTNTENRDVVMESTNIENRDVVMEDNAMVIDTMDIGDDPMIMDTTPMISRDDPIIPEQSSFEEELSFLEKYLYGMDTDDTR